MKLGDKPGIMLKSPVSDYVVFDLETTGLSPASDQIIELSAVKVKGGRVTEEFSALVNPGIAIPYRASMINNITDQMVEDEPDISRVLPLFLDFIGDSVLVGHNIKGFDLKLLYRDCQKLFKALPENDYIDTLILSRVCYPAARYRSLKFFAEYFQIPYIGAHRALNDCRVNQIVYEKFAGMVRSGQTGQSIEGEKICPRCGRALVRRKGRFGSFWGCTGFPECRYTENIR